MVFDSKTRNKKQRFCSKKCSASREENKGRLKKGCIAWNKGVIGENSHSFGKVFSEERKKKIGMSHLKEKSYIWKGEDAGYSSKHKWIHRHIGKASQCEFCGKTGDWIDWANKSGLYKRELTDWMQLCRSCHKVYDTGKEAIKV